MEPWSPLKSPDLNGDQLMMKSITIPNKRFNFTDVSGVIFFPFVFID